MNKTRRVLSRAPAFPQHTKTQISAVPGAASADPFRFRAATYITASIDVIDEVSDQTVTQNYSGTIIPNGISPRMHRCAYSIRKIISRSRAIANRFDQRGRCEAIEVQHGT